MIRSHYPSLDFVHLTLRFSKTWATCRIFLEFRDGGFQIPLVFEGHGELVVVLRPARVQTKRVAEGHFRFLRVARIKSS